EYAAEFDPPKPGEPPNCAVSEWMPTASAEVLNVALPPAPTEPEPSVAAPSLKVTVPEFGPPVSEATCAVIVTLELKVDGFGDEETLVVVAALQPGSATRTSNG